MNKLMAIAGILFLLAGLASAQGLQTYKANYEHKLDKILLTHGTKMTELGQQYIKALDALHERMKNTGDLDRTLAAIQEAERFEEQKTMPDTPSDVLDIQDLQSQYARRASVLESSNAKTVVALATRYDESLNRLQRRLVTADKLDQARAVQEERKACESSPPVLAAKQILLRAVKPPVEAAPARSDTYKWSFDGSTLNGFEMEGDGRFLESNGKVAVKSYTLGKGWHGPKASTPVSLDGDFQLVANVNYQTQGRELGRIAAGVRLESGEIYTLAILDNHVSVIGHSIDFTCNAGMMWSTDRKSSTKRFSNYPLTIQRRNDTLTFLVKNQPKGSHENCDTSKVEEVFFTIQQFSDYPALTKASISEIVLIPVKP